MSESTRPVDKVRQFYRKNGLPDRDRPTHIDLAEADGLRFLLLEEVQELLGAMARNDLIKIADGLGDVLYVVYGMAIQYGIDVDAVFDEIHTSNMTKSPDDPASAWLGKVQRGRDYRPPNLDGVLGVVSDQTED